MLSPTAEIAGFSALPRPAEVDRLCKQYALNARPRARYRGCYFPIQKLAIVPHGDAATLAHELRHAREGAFHS